MGLGLVARGVSFRRQEDPLLLGRAGIAARMTWAGGPPAPRGAGPCWAGVASGLAEPQCAASVVRLRPAAAAALRLGSALRGRTGTRRAAARRRSWNRPRALRIQTRRCVFTPAERTGNLREGVDSIRGRGPGGAAGAGAAGPGPRVPSWWSGERGRGRCRRRSAGGVRRLCHDEMALRARRPPGRPPIAEMA